MAVYLNNHLIGINSNTIIEHNTNTAVIIEPITITANGTQTAPSGKAYSPITIDVPPTLRPIQLRPDVELIQTYSKDYKMAEGDGDSIAGIEMPTYSTSSQALQATINLTPTVTLDYENYNYYVSERALIIPEYNIDTKGKGRIEYQVSAYNCELIDIPGNFFKTMDGSKTYTSRYVPVYGQSYYMEVYWSSGSAIAPYATSTYGIIPVPNAPTISSGKLTIKTPTINARGHTTYFTSTYYNALTDIRVQYIIEVYRAPKNHLNLDGWTARHAAEKIRTCIDDNNCHLT